MRVRTVGAAVGVRTHAYALCAMITRCRYWTLLSTGQQQRLLELLTTFVNDLYSDMGNQIGRRFVELLDKTRHMSRLRNAFKCTLYFYCTLIQVAEKLHTPVVVERRKLGRTGAAGAKVCAAAAAPRHANNAPATISDEDQLQLYMLSLRRAHAQLCPIACA